MGEPWCPPPARADRPTSGRGLAERRIDQRSTISARRELTTNMDRAKLAGTAVISATDVGPPTDSIALAFQIRAIPRNALEKRIRALTDS